MATIEEVKARMSRISEETPQATPLEQPSEAPQTINSIAASQPLKEDNQNALTNFNYGLTTILGAPVDLINIPLKAIGAVDQDATSFLSSKYLRDNFKELGMSFPEEGSRPDGIVNRFARLSGESVLPVMKFGGTTTQIANPKNMSRLKKSLLSAYNGIRRTQVGSIAGATAGGHIGAELYPESFIGETIGELAGAFTPSAAISAANRLPSVSAVRSAVKGSGATRRASKRIQTQSGDLPTAIANVQEESLLGLTGATVSEDAGLLALQQAAMSEDPKILQTVLDGFAKSTVIARSKVLGGGNPSDAIDYLTNIRNKASAESQKIINDFGMDVDPLEASRALREVVDDSYKAARETEKAVWNKLPFTDQVDQQGIVNTFKDILSKKNIADDPENIPNFLHELIGRQTDKGFVLGKISKDPSFATLKSFRTRIQQSRQAERAKDVPNRAKLGVLGDVEESIFDVMTEVSPEYADAVDFSRNLNISFTQGRVGKLLGFERSGGQTVTPEGSFKYITGGDTDKARKGIRQVLNSSPEAKGIMEDNLKSLFRTQATSVDGALDVDKANRFLSSKSVMLEEFPDIAEGVRNSIRKQTVVDEMLGRDIGSRVSKQIKDKSVMSLYLDTGADNAMHNLLTSRNSEGAGAVMKKMVEKVNLDKSGQALSGLKTSFGEYLIRHSEVADTAALSGNRFLKLLDKLQPAAKELLKPEELSRMKRIGVELRRIELARKAQATKTGVINDAPSKIIGLFGGGAAARLGGSMGGGSGGSLRTANLASTEFKEQIGNITNDKARNSLIAAINDPKVMEALLLEASPENIRKASSILRPVFKTQAALATTQEETPDKASIQDRIEALKLKQGQ